MSRRHRVEKRNRPPRPDDVKCKRAGCEVVIPGSSAQYNKRQKSWMMPEFCSPQCFEARFLLDQARVLKYSNIGKHEQSPSFSD